MDDNTSTSTPHDLSNLFTTQALDKFDIHNVARNDVPGYATFVSGAWVPSKGSSLGNHDSWSTSSWSDSGWDDTSWVPSNQYSRWCTCGSWCPYNCAVWADSKQRTMERQGFREIDKYSSRMFLFTSDIACVENLLSDGSDFGLIR